MSRHKVQVWQLSAHGREHRVEVEGSTVARTARWYVDGGLVALGLSAADNSIRLLPGDGLDADCPEPETSATGTAATGAPPTEPPGVGGLQVRFTALGRPRRVTWHPPASYGTAAARALRWTGGVDLDAEPGSPAARREQRIRRHPRLYSAMMVAGGVAKVVLPLLLGLLLVGLTVYVPWPDWDLPAIPWPDIGLPSIPWPDIELPDWRLPGWLTWLLQTVQFVWPVLLAWVLVRGELRRRRQQDELKARLRAEAGEGQGPPAD